MNRNLLLASFLSVFFLAPAFHSPLLGKSLSCGQCQATERDSEACRAACGFSVTGKPAKELFSAMQGIEAGVCKGNSCQTTLQKLDCHWSNSSDSKNASCRYEGKDGKLQTVEGAKARRLGLAVIAKYKWEPSCGAGSCGFHEALQVNCSEVRTQQEKNGNHECRVEVMAAKAKGKSGSREVKRTSDEPQADPSAQ
jgi:hypothetical protein